MRFFFNGERDMENILMDLRFQFGFGFWRFEFKLVGIRFSLYVVRRERKLWDCRIKDKK